MKRFLIQIEIRSQEGPVGRCFPVPKDPCSDHGCPKPKHAPLPKNRAEWWAAKLARNCARDRLVTRTLRKAGWRVVRVWECDLAKMKNWPRVARRIFRALGSGRVSRDCNAGAGGGKMRPRRTSG